MEFVFGSAMISDIAHAISNVPDHGSAKDKVSSYEKLVLGSGVRFLFLFVLMDVILLNLDLQKRTPWKFHFSTVYTFT